MGPDLSWRAILNAMIFFGGSILVYALMVLVVPDPFVMGNERSQFRLLESLVIHSNAEIFDAAADHSIRDGRMYSNKAPGFPLLMWPFFEAWMLIARPEKIESIHFYYFGRIFNGVTSATTVALSYLYLRSFKFSAAAVLFGVIAVAYGTLALTYATPTTSIPLSVFLIILGLYFARIAEQDNPKPIIFLLVIVAIISSAFVVEYKTAAATLPLAIFCGVRLLHRGWMAFLFACVVAAAPLSILMAYNTVIFGEPFVLSYEYYNSPDYVRWNGLDSAFSFENFVQASWGLSFSPSRGIFVLSPVTVLGVLGAYIGIRRGCTSLWLPLTVALTGFILVSFYQFWFGGHSVGYRHVISSAVLLALMSAFFFDHLKDKTFRVACVVLLAFSCFFAGSAWLIQNDPDLRDAVWLDEKGTSLQGNFLTDLLVPCWTRDDRCIWRWPVTIEPVPK